MSTPITPDSVAEFTAKVNTDFLYEPINTDTNAKIQAAIDSFMAEHSGSYVINYTLEDDTNTIKFGRPRQRHNT